jgi:perosamine synthetase
MDSTATFHANAIPVYADIDPDTFNIDPRDIERKITDKTKAIIIVSLYGLPCDMDEIMSISRKYNIPVIEDNAQCFLSTYKGKLAGTFGDIASYSFENSKHMSCGEGGIIITNSEKYARLCRKTAGHGYKNLEAEDGLIKLNQSVYQDPDYKRHDSVGWNYRLSEISAAIAIAQLEKLEENVELRQKVSEMFLSEISSTNYLIPQKVPDDRTNSYFTFGVKFEGLDSIGVTWQEFRNKYVDFGGDGIYGAWAVPYLEPVISEKTFAKRCPLVYNDIEYKKGLCPVAESIQPKLMQFKTNYRSLELAEIKAQALKKTIKHFKEKK